MPKTRRAGEPISIMGRVDAAFFTFSAASAVWLGYLLAREGARPGWQSLLLIVFWLFAAYLLLPRLHRILTKVYVPGYFIGRARTSDGLLGDPVNLALLGDEAQLHHAMTRAGWTLADGVDLASSRRIVTSTLRRRSYREAPVSPLSLFDRQQDFAYQQEVAGNPAKRHHVRFWRCPAGWMLPGGYAVDWLAAGTYDRAVGLSLFTLQVTHKIEADIDRERDFVVQTISESDVDADVSLIENFSTGYHSRTGGGDRIQTDGDLPVLDMRRIDCPDPPAAEPTGTRHRRPAPTVFGAGVALLRGLVYLAFAVLLIVSPDDFERFANNTIDVTDGNDDTLALFTAVILVIAAIVDTGLGFAVLVGRNWARLVLMSVSVFTTIGAFVSTVRGREAVTVVHLPTVGLSILVLLALSSHRARDFATGTREHGSGTDGPEVAGHGGRLKDREPFVGSAMVNRRPG